MKLYYNTVQFTRRCDGMVDVMDSKSIESNLVPVQVRPPVPVDLGFKFGTVLLDCTKVETLFIIHWS